MKKLKIWMKKTLMVDLTMDAHDAHFNPDDNYELVVDVILNDEFTDGTDGTDEVLEKIYHLAQNSHEFGWIANFTGMKYPYRSLSVGDVIELSDEYYRVESFGFYKV